MLMCEYMYVWTVNIFVALPSLTILIINRPSPFIPGLKSSLRANLSHRNLPFSSGQTPRIPRTVRRYFGAYPSLLFSVSLFPLFSCWFRAVD